jgi:hypothetical protein
MVGAGAAALLAACADGDSSLGALAGSGESRTTVTRGGTGTTGGGGGSAQEPNHFRLSSRHSRTKPCNACTSHINSRFYATAEAAEADRPHQGCSCRVRGRVISDGELEAMFRDGSRDIYDARTD